MVNNDSPAVTKMLLLNDQETTMEFVVQRAGQSPPCTDSNQILRRSEITRWPEAGMCRANGMARTTIAIETFALLELGRH